MGRVITDIQVQKNDPKRVNIYLDGQFAFGTASILVAWLRVGQTISEEKVNELIQQDDFETAYQKALHYLSFKARSEHDVRNNLSSRNISIEVIDEVISRLQINHLLDDRQYARDWIANRQEFHPRSKTAISIELRRKGLTPEIIQEALELGADDESLANLAAEKYQHRLEKLNKVDFTKRLGNHLSTRGFSYSTIRPVIAKTWQKIHLQDLNSSQNDKE